MSDQPAPRLPSPDNPFEIGLVMAGAISAGAYSAGVVDFFIQALDQWEQAKAQALAQPDDPASRLCPMHEVKLRVMAGASAGGMTAGLASGLLGMAYESVTTQPPPDRPSAPIVPENNNLYRSWVNTIDINALLGVEDFDADPGSPAQSLLDSTILNKIASEAFAFEAPAKTLSRSYVADPLHVILTVTNLRGVPYPVTFTNSQKIQEYVMTMHADNMHFVVSTDSSQAGPESLYLKPFDTQNKDTWGHLLATSLATGAFPFGLAPRLLRRSPAQYQYREWAIPTPCQNDSTCTYLQWKSVPPYWPLIDQASADAAKLGKEFTYEFLCVDGGVTNNEPLDLVRAILAGPDGVNPRDGDKAIRAVIMVMPFPNADPFPAQYDSRTNLLKLLVTLFFCLMRQARFQPEELALADDPDVYSRFLIVPRRGSEDDGSIDPYPIASGSLEGFGGFLCRRFREHDYQLGRRNCQRFLKEDFALPSEGDLRNKIFDLWSPEARSAHAIEGGFLPIIPLVGTAAAVVPEPQWPTLTPTEFDSLQPRVATRLGRIVGATIRQYIQGKFWSPAIRLLVNGIWRLESGRAVDSIMNLIGNDLKSRNLMK